MRPVSLLEENERSRISHHQAAGYSHGVAANRSIAGACALAVLVASLIPLMQARGAQSANLSPFGTWILDDGAAAVEIGPCGDSICGRVVGVAPSSGHAVTTPDGRSIAPGESRRPLCGQTVLAGFRAAGDGVYREGYIFNPSDGRTYSATLTLESADVLRVRAYVAAEFLGQTRRLYRADSAVRLRGYDQCSGSPR